jgi:hypothetical protein
MPHSIASRGRIYSRNDQSLRSFFRGMDKHFRIRDEATKESVDAKNVADSCGTKKVAGRFATIDRR